MLATLVFIALWLFVGAFIVFVAVPFQMSDAYRTCPFKPRWVGMVILITWIIIMSPLWYVVETVKDRE